MQKNKTRSPKCPAGQSLTTPETVHWAITYQCSENCPDCYALHHRRQGVTELDTDEAFMVIGLLADWGVFQLDIGGGEPFMRPDLLPIVKHARNKGMAIHITTGQEELAAPVLKQFADYVNTINVGINHHFILSEPQVALLSLENFVMHAAECNIITGANIILSDSSLRNIAYIIKNLEQIGFKRITFLRYKPPADVQQWLKEKPNKKVLDTFIMTIPEILNNYPQINFHFDCALSFIMNKKSPPEAFAEGIRGCVAGDRIMALGADGSLYPCSQLSYPSFCAGHIFGEILPEFWQESDLLSNYRFFRNSQSYKTSICGLCQAKDHCGGCRVFSHDTFHQDVGCPEHRLSSLIGIGKKGRKADLVQYLKYRNEISVEEYMERYGLGQKQTLKEIKNTRWLQKSRSQEYSSKKGKGRKVSKGDKKTDIYFKESDEGLLYSIQNSIGYTSGGLPFATTEEIASWVDFDSADYNHYNETDFEGTHRGYPKWLKKINAT